MAEEDERDESAKVSAFIDEMIDAGHSKQQALLALKSGDVDGPEDTDGGMGCYCSSTSSQVADNA